MTSSAPSSINAQQDAFWWQGSVMTVKARAEDTGGALGLVDGSFYRGGSDRPYTCTAARTRPCTSSRGQIRFRQADEEFIAGPGTWVWHPRGVPHAFKVESESARALVVVTPGGFERMFEEGGVPASESAEPPEQEYDPQAAVEISKRFGFEVVGPQLA